MSKTSQYIPLIRHHFGAQAVPNWVTEMLTNIRNLEESLRVEKSCNRCGEYHGKEPCADVDKLFDLKKRLDKEIMALGKVVYNQTKRADQVEDDLAKEQKEYRNLQTGFNRLDNALAEVLAEQDLMGKHLEAEGHDCEFQTNPVKGSCDWCSMMASWRARNSDQKYHVWKSEVEKILKNLGFKPDEITNDEELGNWFEDNLRPEEAVSEMFRP